MQLEQRQMVAKKPVFMAWRYVSQHKINCLQEKLDQERFEFGAQSDEGTLMR